MYPYGVNGRNKYKNIRDVLKNHFVRHIFCIKNNTKTIMYYVQIFPYYIKTDDY